RSGTAWWRGSPLQERHRRLHNGGSRQRSQPAQRRFLLAARGRRRGHHCSRRGRSATMATLAREGVMSSTRRGFIGGLTLLAVLPLVAHRTGAQTRNPTIGVALAQDDNPLYILMLKGIRARAQELGWEVVTVSSNEDKLKQIHGVQDLIARGVNGVLISPIDAVG